MTKREDKLDSTMRVLKTDTCKTLSGKSTLTYQVGRRPDSSVHLRIAKNSGNGFFSDEWIAFDDVQEVLRKRPKGAPVLSHHITPVFTGKSVNTSAFMLAALSHLKLVKPLPNNKRHHELQDPQPFLDQVKKLMSSPEKTKTSTKAKAPKTPKTQTKTKTEKTEKTAKNPAEKVDVIDAP